MVLGAAIGAVTTRKDQCPPGSLCKGLAPLSTINNAAIGMLIGGGTGFGIGYLIEKKHRRRFLILGDKNNIKRMQEKLPDYYNHEKSKF